MNTVLTHFGHHLNVVVVGASGGIGRALVNQLLEDHSVDRVYGLSRTPVSVSHHKWRSLTFCYQREHTIIDAAALVDQPIHIVLVATGLLHSETDNISPEKSYRQLDAQAVMQHFLINTLGPGLIAKYFLPLMARHRRCYFGALSARVGSISDNRLGGWHSYRASKAALNMLLRNLAIESQRLFPELIITGLHPGTVATALSKPFQRNVAQHQLFSVDFSATRLLNVINHLNSDDSGKCFAWDGQEILP